jgi:hypothetical protein
MMSISKNIIKSKQKWEIENTVQQWFVEVLRIRAALS